jgi:hypothetical protein
MIVDFLTEAEAAAWIEMDARHEVNVIDDIHWIDPSSREWLPRCGERLPSQH